MKDRYVIDTNVLIGASAGDPVQPKDIDATPKDPSLRLKIWEWLERFQSSPARLILDSSNGIYDEYYKKLGFNDFGIQVVIHKWSTAEVDIVEIEYDADGFGMLHPELSRIVHDGEDRKMVAAAVHSLSIYGDGTIAFSGDTDWHDWEVDLLQAGLSLEPIIEEWSRKKHLEKQNR